MHRFGVWAPKAQKVTLTWRDQSLLMTGPNQRGWWTLEVPEAGCGDRYAFLLDDDETRYPDPRGLRQPDGVHGASELYDHGHFKWHDQLWRGAPKIGSVIYELHIGTFSKEGTFDGAVPHLQYLADLGVTHVEVMPVAAWAGQQGWGYDGVALFATHEPYGGPDGFKRFVDACHGAGLSVILDVVYNHFGPAGNYSTKFGPYLNKNRNTPWGDAVNLDEEGSDEVRRFFVDNALMWLKDYHCDGLRFDAVHAFLDLSAVHFMEQLSIEVERLSATLAKDFYLIAESDLNDPRVVRSREANGYGMDSQWSDDFHHSLFALLYSPKEGEAVTITTLDDSTISTKRWNTPMCMTGSTPTIASGGMVDQRMVSLPITSSISTRTTIRLETEARGERLEHLIGLDAAKVSMGLLLTAPYIPMLFMGEEWATSAPFLYFADHDDEELRKQVAEGRQREFATFGFDGDVPNPEEPETYERSKLNWEEQSDGRHGEMLDWVKSLIRLRRSRVLLQ